MCRAVVSVAVILGAIAGEARGKPLFQRDALELEIRQASETAWKPREPRERELGVDAARVTAEEADRVQLAKAVRRSYQEGWERWREGKYTEATVQFHTAANLASDLRDTAIYELILVEYAATKAYGAPFAKARGNFQWQDLDRLALQLEAYADESYRIGKHEQAAEAYRLAYDTDPKARQACHRAIGSVMATIPLGDQGAIRERVKQVAAVKKCAHDLRSTVLELALVWHREAHGAGSAGVDAAIELYQLTENLYPREGALAARFLRADLLAWRADVEHDPAAVKGAWERAARASTFTDSEVARLERELGAIAVVDGAGLFASRQAALAWMHALSLDVDFHPSTSRMPDRGELSEPDAAAAAALTAYARRLGKPRDPEALSFQFLAGVLYWKHGLAAEAAEVLAKVATHGRDFDFAEAAELMLLDSLEKAGKSELKKWRKALGR